MSGVPDYCDRIVAALCEAGYPPSQWRDGGEPVAVWDPPPPWDLFAKAHDLSGGPLILTEQSGWATGEALTIRTNRRGWS